MSDPYPKKPSRRVSESVRPMPRDLTRRAGQRELAAPDRRTQPPAYRHMSRIRAAPSTRSAALGLVCRRRLHQRGDVKWNSELNPSLRIDLYDPISSRGRAQSERQRFVARDASGPTKLFEARPLDFIPLNGGSPRGERPSRHCLVARQVPTQCCPQRP